MPVFGVKTFVFGFVFIVERLCRYARRYENQILASLESQENGAQYVTAFNTLLAACDVFKALMRIYEPN